MPTEAKGFFITSILAVAILLGLVFYNTRVQDRTSEMAPESAVSPADIASWKTYRNEEYGLEVKYPEKWFALSGSDYFATRPHKFTEGDDRSTFSIEVYSGKRASEVYSDFSEECKGIAFKDLQTYQCVLGDYGVLDGGLGPTSFIYVERDNNVYEIGDGLDDEISRQILSTFKFVEE